MLKGFMERFFGWKVILEIRESNITVVKRKEDRILMSHNIIYSKLSDGSIYTHSYWDYFLPLAAIRARPKVLVLGLAGGTIPYQMKKVFGERVSITAVELDRNMVAASKVFLPERLDVKLEICDAYDYVRDTREKYDLIVLDIFKRLDIPEKFRSAAFIENAYRALTSEGVLAVNYLLSGSEVLRPRFKRRLRKRFTVYTVSNRAAFDNKILICSKGLGREALLNGLRRRFPKSSESAHIMKSYLEMS